MADEASGIAEIHPLFPQPEFVYKNAWTLHQVDSLTTNEQRESIHEEIKQGSRPHQNPKLEYQNWSRKTAEGVPRYLVEEAGQKGGSSLVHKAQDGRIPGRMVALKFMNGIFLNDPDLRHQFELEAKIMAKLEHPNILPVYDYFITKEYIGKDKKSGIETPVIAMKYMAPETSLDYLIKNNQIVSKDQIIQITGGLANAVDFMDKKEIYHRDLKPKNIFIQDGIPLVADFGAVNTIQRDQGLRASVGYVAPERIVQRIHKDTVKAEIFNLGLITYEMITGQAMVPKSPKTDKQLDNIYTMALVDGLSDENKIILEHSLGKFKIDAKHKILEVISKATSKDPLQRFDSGQEYARALEEAFK